MTQGSKSISYAYNADGLRTSKTVNGVTTEFYWLEGRLIGKKSGSDTILFLYDENGRAYGFVYNGSPYYYYFNLQGDVIHIMGTDGGAVASYSYDEWGYLLSVTGNTTIGNLNPIRYRGYYYDTETGFYYLQSRYYDPEIGRFITADNIDYLGTDGSPLSYNLFAYCENNPVNHYKLIRDGEIANLDLISEAPLKKGLVPFEPLKTVKTYFETEKEAVEDWAEKYRELSKEYGAFLYKHFDENAQKVYYSYGNTYQGNRKNVILGFVTGYVCEGAMVLFDPSIEMIGFIHTHPKPTEGRHNDFLSEADLFLYQLHGIQKVYLVPYRYCRDGHRIIVGDGGC